LTCPARRLSHCYLLLSTTAPYDCALQPCWVCLVLCEQGHPAKKGRENTTTPPPLLLIFSSPRLLRDGYLLLRLSSKRSEEGEREELITNRGLATVVFMLGLCQEVQTQRRGRENERFLPLSSRPKQGETLGFYWVCEESPNPGEEEEESTCVSLSSSPPP
jgi:hypothetical protein